MHVSTLHANHVDRRLSQNLLVRAGLLGLLLLCQPAQLLACAGEDYCHVAEGRYLAIVPSQWDGHSALPTTVFFHGYGSSAKGILRNRALLRVMAQRGTLLILPDGRNNTWAHQGSPSSARDDIAFMDAVLADVQQRWPVDPSRLYAMGFSQGGSMTWDLACQRGQDYAAFMPIAGAFWDPLPTDCPGGPVNLRHVHGLADGVVPMAGRPIAGRFHQGDVYAGMALWRQVNGCPKTPDREFQQDTLRCEVWDHCDGGRELQLCLHEGGHSMPGNWENRSHDWADGLLDSSADS